MPNLINCPGCLQELRVPDTLLGQLVKCPTCGKAFTAPATVVEEVASRPPESPAGSPPPPPPPPPPPVGEVVPEPHKPYTDLPPPGRKPDKVQAIGVMMLIGGILATLLGLGLSVGSGFACCLWPGTYYSLVLGIMAIVRASNLLGEKAYTQTSPKGIAIMQIVNIINMDIANLVLGIVILTFLNEREVQAYFRGK
jgi:hypothetical protein